MNQPKMTISRNCALHVVHYEGSNVILFKSLKRANCKDFIAANTMQCKAEENEFLPDPPELIIIDM